MFSLKAINPNKQGDEFERYKRPVLNINHFSFGGGGIEITNIKEVALALVPSMERKNPGNVKKLITDIFRFFKKKLGLNITLNATGDDAKVTAIYKIRIMGMTTLDTLEKALEQFICDELLCPICHLPELNINRSECYSCGFLREEKDKGKEKTSNKSEHKLINQTNQKNHAKQTERNKSKIERENIRENKQSKNNPQNQRNQQQLQSEITTKNGVIILNVLKNRRMYGSYEYSDVDFSALVNEKCNTPSHNELNDIAEEQAKALKRIYRTYEKLNHQSDSNQTDSNQSDVEECSRLIDEIWDIETKDRWERFKDTYKISI